MSNKQIETNSSAKGTNQRLSVKEGSKIGEVTQDQLDSVERFADKAMAPIDVDFTNHFLDRVTDPRNGKMITVAELVSFFKRLSNYKTQFMEFLRKYSEFVTTHKRYELNIPFVRMGNRLVAKTIMRKPNFLTSNPKFKFESFQTHLFETEIPKGKWITPPTKGDRGEELVDLVKTAYRRAPDGSFVNSVGDLTPSEWIAKDFNEDPKLDVTIFYRKSRSGETWTGFKIQGIGHNGSDEAKKLVLNKLKELLNKNGYWVEASDALESALYKMGVPYVSNEEFAKRIFPNSKLKMLGTGGKYSRYIGTKTIKETIFGKPKLKSNISEANDALQLDKSVREFEALMHKRTKEENEKILINILNKYVDFINSVLDKFYKHINSLLPKKGLKGKVEFLHQKKTEDSILDKVIVRGKKLTQISDLVRGAILFQYDKDMDEFVKDFTKKSKYIVKIEPKLKGQSEYGYYGAYHVDLNIDGLDVEVQITTKKLWAYKGEAHKIYDKWRSDPTKMDKFDRNLSKQLFFKGNQVKFRENIEDNSEEITENNS